MQNIKILLALGFAFLLVGCNSSSSVQVKDSHADPSVKHIGYKNLFIVVSAPTEKGRNAVENSIRRSLPNVKSVPSHTVLPSAASLQNLDLLKKTVSESGCDGLAFVRLLSDRKEERFQEPVITLSRVGMFGYGGLTEAPPPIIDHIVIVEVALYDTKTEKLQWTGTVEILNPGSASKTGTEIAQAVVAKLRTQGLVQ
jgi:hypothetical protein